MTSKPDSTPDENRRCLPDRRAQPTSAWRAFPPAGRRIEARRAAEHQRPYFVDRFQAVTLVSVSLLLLACLLDGAMTLHLLEAGASEINPLMWVLAQRGPFSFIVGKYVLTAIGLPVLLIFKNHYILGGRLRVDYLIPMLVVAYTILLAYQVYLLRFDYFTLVP